MPDGEKAAPVVGMPSRMDPGKDSQYLSRHYADSVSGAGGIPVILPLLESPSAIRSFVQRLDGILLTGSSSDVDPLRYGAARAPACGGIQPLRDETDFLLLEIALQCRKPTLAICFGMQSLNVFLGGSLIQDIPSSMQSSIEHQNPSSEGRPSHEVEIVKGSLLEGLAGGCRSMVNSTHHQALDRIGRDLKIIARAPDGIVEAVIGTTPDQFILGVQWHPEKSYAFDSFSKEIFDLFLSRCREASNRL